MLETVKPGNKSYIEYCSEFSNLFTKEYYLNIFQYDKIIEFCEFNSPEIIAGNIKDKYDFYYIIKHNGEMSGYVLLNKGDETLNISQIFILKRFRKQKLLSNIVEEIKNIAKTDDYIAVSIYIVEGKKALQKIFEKFGFSKKEKIAKYIGDNIYIYESKYCIQL